MRLSDFSHISDMFTLDFYWDTLPKFNMEPIIHDGFQKESTNYSRRPFSGSMLNFGRVWLTFVCTSMLWRQLLSPTFRQIPRKDRVARRRHHGVRKF